VRSAIEPVTSWPATVIRPDDGGIAVASSRSSVDLPAPLGPRSPITPGSSARSVESSASVEPYDFVTPLSSAMGLVMRSLRTIEVR
jgi:hypothetical protein